MDPGSAGELIRRVWEGFVPIVQQVPGRVSWLGINWGNGRIGSASVYADKSAADESTRRAADWIESNLSSLLPNPPSVETCAVLLRHTRGQQRRTSAAEQSSRPKS
jgi:hypothetical protein